MTVASRPASARRIPSPIPRGAGHDSDLSVQHAILTAVRWLPRSAADPAARCIRCRTMRLPRPVSTLPGRTRRRASPCVRGAGWSRSSAPDGRAARPAPGGSDRGPRRTRPSGCGTTGTMGLRTRRGEALAQALGRGLHERAVRRCAHRQHHHALGALPARGAPSRLDRRAVPGDDHLAYRVEVGGLHPPRPAPPRRTPAATRIRRGRGSRRCLPFLPEPPPASPGARKRTSGSASSKRSASAATSALYSPRLWFRHQAGSARCVPPRAPAGHARDEHHGLRVHGLVERFRWTVANHRPQIGAEDRVRLEEGLLDDGRVGEARHHADRLRALSREYQGECHVST